MSPKSLLLSWGLLFLALSPATAQQWVSLDPASPPGTPPAIRVLSCNASATTLEIKIPGFWAEKTPSGWKLRFPGRLRTTDLGRPELPFVGCTLALPREGRPTFSLKSASYVLPGRFQVRMAPKLEPEGESYAPGPPVAPGVPYPPAPFKVTATGLWRTVPVATIQIHPFKAKGDGTILGVAARMVVEVTHPGSPGSWPPAPLPEEFEPLLRSAFPNGRYVPVVEPRTDAYTTEYLVIANSSLASAVAPLVNWRRREGFKTELISTTSSNPATIKNYIQSRFASGKLKFVVLVGDYAQIPWYMWNGNRSDSWYACLTGGSNPDLYPDVGLGRLSGTTTGQISVQVNKILAYEQNPPTGSWFTKTILTAHKEGGATGRFTKCAETIANGPLKTSGWATIKQYGYQPGVNNTTLSNYINAGAGLVLYRGHGGTTYWSSWCNASPSSFTTGNIAALHNGKMTPVVFSICCNTGNFSYSTCFTEQWLRVSQGAVACIGATNVSYTSGNTPMAIEFYRAIFQDKTTNIYGFYFKGISKALAVGGYGGQKAAYLFCWMGDTCTNLWFRAPTTMKVSHPTSITVGAHNVTVSAVPLAKVCLYKGTEVFAVGTCSIFTGKVTLNVHPTTPGPMLVTVTARDRRPYLGSISVTSGGAVIPDGLERAEGSTYRHIPSRYAPNRCQHLYDASILKGVSSGYIKGVEMRRDGRITTSFQAHKYYFDVHLSSLGVKSAAYWNKTSYKANRGLDYTLVLGRTLVNFPATPKPAVPPAPFTVKVPFKRFFRYYKGRNLLVQFDVSPASGSTASYLWYADAQYYSSSGTGHAAVKYGKGCPPGRTLYGYAPPINGTSKLYWYWYSGGGYSTPAMAILGVSKTKFLGFPLPFPLAGIGAPGCWLNCDIAAAFPGTTDPSGVNGRYRVDLPVPYNPVFAGATVYGQTFVFKKGFNYAGLMASEGLQFKLGSYVKPVPALQLYTYGVAPPFPDKPRFFYNCGLVLKLDM